MYHLGRLYSHEPPGRLEKPLAVSLEGHEEVMMLRHRMPPPHATPVLALLSAESDGCGVGTHALTDCRLKPRLRPLGQTVDDESCRKTL